MGQTYVDQVVHQILNSLGSVADLCPSYEATSIMETFERYNLDLSLYPVVSVDDAATAAFSALRSKFRIVELHRLLQVRSVPQRSCVNGEKIDMDGAGHRVSTSNQHGLLDPSAQVSTEAKEDSAGSAGKVGLTEIRRVERKADDIRADSGALPSAIYQDKLRLSGDGVRLSLPFRAITPDVRRVSPKSASTKVLSRLPNLSEGHDAYAPTVKLEPRDGNPTVSSILCFVTRVCQCGPVRRCRKLQMFAIWRC